jgi:hypothetical protein
MLARYRWLEFGGEILASFEDQARRTPDTACAVSVGKRDMAGRVPPTPSKTTDPPDPRGRALPLPLPSR